MDNYEIKQYGGVALMHHYANSYEIWDTVESGKDGFSCIERAKILSKIDCGRYKVINVITKEIIFDTK